jgi:mannitol/fructose-specific phosphotransferase system IIA component (Ntr-type)
MKLRDIVVEKAIIAPLKSTKRDDAIRELVDCLAANGAVKPALADELSKAVIKREKKGSTGFGHGVAAPHVKTPEVQRVFAAVGIAPGGLEFQALDKQLVVCYVARRPSRGCSRCFSQDACGLPLAFNVGRLHTHDARAIPRYL